MIASRRDFLTGLSAFLAAPAIVRAASLMPVKTASPVELLPYQETMLQWASGLGFSVGDVVRLEFGGGAVGGLYRVTGIGNTLVRLNEGIQLAS